jgi:Ca-activated chloride channel family protein
MTFLWPEMLWLLAALPMLVLAYWLILRRQKKAAVRYASLRLVKDALGRHAGWRRHLPAALALATVAVMVIAVARPAAVLTLPSEHSIVVLTMDVSGSMSATDVEPTRLAASQAAARAFVLEQPRGTHIGLVEFSGAASIVQPPTRNREDLIAAIERLQPQQATAIGSGILVSLKAIFPSKDFDLLGSPKPRAIPISASAGASAAPDKPASAAVILLTDGQSTTGPDPVEAARLAAELGVRVFTVGIGTSEGTVTGSGGWSMRVGLDEESLTAIARLTGGEYHYAGSALDLKEVYRGLTSQLVMERQETELSALFAAVAMLTLLLSALLSLVWFNRVL